MPYCRKFKKWWSTARSSLVTHKYMKWGWVFLWITCEVTGQVTQTTLVSRLSFIALILGSWSAEESAKIQVKEEEKE